MIIVQIRINFRGNDQNTVEIDLLEREDATAQERELARNIQDLHVSLFEQIADESPTGEVSLVVIEPGGERRVLRGGEGPNRKPHDPEPC